MKEASVEEIQDDAEPEPKEETRSLGERTVGINLGDGQEEATRAHTRGVDVVSEASGTPRTSTAPR